VSNGYEISREQAISLIVENLDERDALVATTGKISRELYECRRLRNGAGSEQDFLAVGSMGHASQIALGVALAQPERRVYCLDGDGALIMHLGSLAIIGSRAPRNFVHVVLNNGCHESVGGQPTAGLDIDVSQIAKACGYRTTNSATSLAELRTSLKSMTNEEGPCLLEVRVSSASRKDLGRPDTSLVENRNRFMKFLQQ
jgi:phosphonopyruvate decarboxylase